MENLWNEEFAGAIIAFAGTKRQKQIPCGDDNKKGNGKKQIPCGDDRKKNKGKNERLRGSAAFSDLYSSILSN